MRRTALLFVIAFAAGCVGDLVDITPKPGVDGGGGSPDIGGGGGGDMGGGGGGDMSGTTQSTKFTPDIQNDIHMLGCASSSCHGGTQIPVLKDPATDTTTQMTNYTNFTALANTGANSPVLTKNLATSGVTHAGGKAFQSTSDPVYVRWLGWINAGNPP